MKTFSIPENDSEVSIICPFCNNAGLHSQLRGKIFADNKLPHALAVYYCGTYIWDNGRFDLGSDCIGILK